MRRQSLIAATLLIMAACAPAPSPATTGSSHSNVEPTAVVVPSTSSTPASSDLVEVAVAQLSIGAAPAEVTGSVVGVLPATVPAGTRLWVLEQLDGWMLVVAPDLAVEDATPIGWAQAVSGGEPSVRPVDLACPASPVTVQQLVALGSLGGLTCYGNGQIELIGFTPLGCGVGGSSRVGTPEWLNGTWTGVGIGNREPTPPDFEVEFAIAARAAPGRRVASGCGDPGWYRFVGHFDDPASVTCRTEIVEAPPVLLVEPRISQLLCRGNFVLDSSVRLHSEP
jgi:hypothetical protein